MAILDISFIVEFTIITLHVLIDNPAVTSYVWLVHNTAPTFTMYSQCRPYSSTLGKAQDTEIFRNMDNFEKVPTSKLHQQYCANGKSITQRI